MRSYWVFLFFVCLTYCFVQGQQFVCGDGCVQLSTVSVLTFSQGQFSHSSDGSIYPQLVCVGGNACSDSNDVIVVQCTNSGTDDTGNTNWKCISDLPNSVNLGTTTVACQGYRYPGDKQYIYSGSCKLLYSLYETTTKSTDDDGRVDDQRDDDDTDGSGVVFVILVVVAIVLCCWCSGCCAPTPAVHRYDYIDETVHVHPGTSTSYIQPQPVVHNTYVQQPPLYQTGGWGYGGGPAVEIVEVNRYGGGGGGGGHHHQQQHHNSGGGGHHHSSSGFGGTMNF